MNSSDITPGFRLVGGIIRAAVGLFCIILGTVFLFISIGGPFSWLMVTVVVLLYVKGLFAWLFAFRFLKGNSSTEWNTLLSPLGWKVSAIGFGAVALLFAFSAAAGEGSWLITGTLVYTALAMICLFAASNSIPEKTQSTWSPFQSPEVQEICEHLTPVERRRIIDDATARGRELGTWLAGPFAIVVVLSVIAWQLDIMSWRSGIVLLILYTVYFWIFGLPRIRDMRRRSIELLCGTEWAHSRGYTPDTLRLTVFPWSKAE